MKFIKAKWKSILFNLILAGLWSTQLFLPTIPKLNFAMLLSVTLVISLTSDLRDYWNDGLIKMIKKNRRECEISFLSTIENLASEITYPQTSPKWRKNILSEMTKLKERYLDENN